MDTNWQTSSWETGPQPAQYGSIRLRNKESKLKLSLETRQRGEVVIIHCQGRIVYRNEAAAFSGLVGEVLANGAMVVVDLGGVSLIDSAGIGELVMLHASAQAKNAEVKYANPRPFVRGLFDLTRLDSVLEIHSSLDDAVTAFEQLEVCADC